MKELIKSLKELESFYKGDPEGFESDFKILFGESLSELTDKINDEINEHKQFS